MNIDIAKEIYLQYTQEMSFEDFEKRLQDGIHMLEQYADMDKRLLNRYVPAEAHTSIHIALTYNQELMVKALLMPS